MAQDEQFVFLIFNQLLTLHFEAAQQCSLCLRQRLLAQWRQWMSSQLKTAILCIHHGPFPRPKASLIRTMSS
jgi:hypothetical protein